MLGRSPVARRPRARRRRRRSSPGVSGVVMRRVVRRVAERRSGGVACGSASRAPSRGAAPPPARRRRRPDAQPPRRRRDLDRRRDRRVPPLRDRRRLLPVERRVHRRRPRDRRPAQGQRLPHRPVGAVRGPLRRGRRAASSRSARASAIHAVVDHIGLVTTRCGTSTARCTCPNGQLDRGPQPEPGGGGRDGAAAGPGRRRPTPTRGGGRVRSLAGTEHLTDVVFVGDLAAEPRRRRRRRRGGADGRAARRASRAVLVERAEQALGVPAGRADARRQTASRLRARAARWRRMARRSSSDSPPQMPESWFVVRAKSRHSTRAPAFAAHLLGPLDLHERRARRADREEQLGIGVPAQRVSRQL